MMRKTLLAIALLAVFPLLAQEVEADANGANAQLKKFMDSLNFQTGDVAIAPAKAVIHASSAYQMLGAKDAQRVLEELWGNPPDSDVLGMLPEHECGGDDGGFKIGRSGYGGRDQTRRVSIPRTLR